MAAFPDYPFDLVDHEFSRLATSVRGVAVDGLDRLAQCPAALLELREAMFDPSVGPDARDAVLRAVWQRAYDDGGDWLTGIAGMVLPLLRKRVRQLTASRPAYVADAQAEALAGLFAFVRVTPPHGDRIANRLANAGLAAARRYCVAQDRETAEPLGELVAPSRDAAHVDLLLATAVAANVVTPGEAELIAATRLDQVPLAEYAAMIGLPYEAVRKRRLRAERRVARDLMSP